jgi:hypothetical protein
VRSFPSQNFCNPHKRRVAQIGGRPLAVMAQNAISLDEDMRNLRAWNNEMLVNSIYIIRKSW